MPLKANTDEALRKAQRSKAKVLVVRRTGAEVPWNGERDLWYHAEMASVSDDCPPAKMKAEDLLFILYTSGSTGKPKGVLHTTGGYLVYASMTHHYVFDYHDGDIYWCTADVGWVTGHSYIVYGPLANGATTLMFEGVLELSRCRAILRQVVDKHKVNIFYTAPTAIRALMGAGDELVTASSRKSLRLLGSVGEPINPEAWEWYRVVGDGRCPIVDMVADRDRRHHDHAAAWSDRAQPGSATRAVLGVKPAVVDGEGREIEGVGQGNLVLTDPGPARCARSMAITSASSKPISRPTRTATSPAMAAGATRMAITGSPAGRRRPQRLRPPHGHGGDRVGAGGASQGVGGGGGRLSA